MRETKAFLEVAVQSAKMAGEVLKSNYGSKLQIEKKSEIDLVTNVDRQAEKVILDHILSKFPEHSILAEESGSIPQQEKYLWLVDPLDGTTNFAHSYPCFCTSIALQIEGELRVAAVYDPLLGELFTAEKGEGAFLNGKKIEVSSTLDLDDSLICTGFSYNVRKNKANNLKEFTEFILSAQAVRRDGSAALDLCYLATGRFDGFWEYNLQPWDIAAGILMIQEAGGLVTNFVGEAFDFEEKKLLASNGHIHGSMMNVLKGANSK